MSKCKHCKSSLNLYGDCGKKCDKWFEDQNWLKLLPTIPKDLLKKAKKK